MTPRPRGRPPKPPEERLVGVTVHLNAAEVALICRTALKHQIAVSALVRQLVRRSLGTSSATE